MAAYLVGLVIKQTGLLLGEALTETTLGMEDSTECALRKKLEQSREERCQEVAALHESNAARVARLQERLRYLEELQASTMITSQDRPSLGEFPGTFRTKVFVECWVGLLEFRYFQAVETKNIEDDV
ncbi:hypothetical protein ACTXT7_001247 [Hymenolepis weldensis]